MESKIYMGRGNTPQEAFESIWESLGSSDDYCLHKGEDGRWSIRLSVMPPSNEETVRFEKNS